MSPIVYEFINYFVAVTSAGISFAISVLFLMAFRRHKTQHTLFRALGFAFIGEAFGFHLFERSYPELGIIAYIFEALGLLFLYYSLLLNNEEGQVFFTEMVFENRPKPLRKIPEFLRFVLTSIVICVAFVLITNQATNGVSITTPALALFLAIMSFEVARLKFNEYKNGTKNSRISLYIFIAFILFGFRHLLNIIFTVPKGFNIPYYENLTSLTGPLWLIINIITLISFLIMAVWQWNFVRKRFFIRVVEVLLTVTILLAISSSAIIGYLGGNIIKDTNLSLVERNTQLINFFFNEKLTLTGKVAEAITSRSRLLESVENRESDVLQRFLNLFSDKLNNSSNFRLYDRTETIIYNPFHPEEQGLKVIDKFIEQVFATKQPISTFGIVPRTNILAGRSLSPIIVDGEVVSVCVINFYYDSDFLQEMKGQTDIDILVYTGDKLTASTIPDSAVNKDFEDNEIINTILEDGEIVTKTTFIGGMEYFANYTPIKDVDGKVIGVLASLKSREIVTEYIRKQLNVTFIVITNVAFLVTVIAYVVLKRGYQKDMEE